MMPGTVRTILLKTFLHKTLGGFADPPPPAATETMARRYANGEKVEAIIAAERYRADALYRALRRHGVPLRSAG